MAGIVSTSSSSSEDISLPTDSKPEVEPVDALLQRRRCELMYELKHLKHGERPVTGTDSRGKVDNFFSKRVQVQDSSTPVANVDDVEEHRPQQVTIEVEGLLQRRSVSSVLQSAGFRRSLENVVRSHISRDGSSSSRAPRRTRALSRQENREAPASASPATETASSVPAPPPPPSLDELRLEDQTNASSERDNTDSLRPLLPNQASSEAEMVLRRWNQDDFVMEISELVHRQLVSTTLQGDFRNRLERHIGRRVAESGTDGHAVQRQIQNLPPSHIRHNDFSHLGIPSPQDQQQQMDDAVSLISATASATIPFAQSNAAVQRELSGMKAQIAQLSEMLKMSLDLQMDIQRSIRQEVAAAVTQATAANAAPETARVETATTARSRRANDSKCIICLDDDADAVLYRCGHICMCYTCALRMRNAKGQCPVCRAPINDIVRAYRISN